MNTRPRGQQRMGEHMRDLETKHPLGILRALAMVLVVGLTASACGGQAPGAAAPGAGVPAAAAPTAAPPYPTKPIELIVPAAPGGGVDVSARLIAGYVSKKWNQPVSVVNMAGASGITGLLHALQSPPDGHTLFMDGSYLSSLLAASRSELPFKLEERSHMGRVTSDPLYYMTFSGSPYTTLKQALDAAIKDPASFTWGAGQFGSSPMFAQLKLFKAANVPTEKTKMLVFEQGNAPSLQALAGGNVLFGIGTAVDAATLTAAGKVRVLGTTALERTKDLPDVATAAELGYKGADFLLWYSISGPPKLPDHVMKAWEKVLSDAAKDPEFLADAVKAKRAISYITGPDVRKYIQDEYNAFLPLARSAGIRKD